MAITRRLLLSFLLCLLIAGCTAGGSAPSSIGNNGLTATTPETLVTTDSTQTSIQPAASIPADTVTPTAQQLPTPTSDPNGPRRVVEDFYRWYFNQPQGEVLTDRTYQNHPLLSGIYQSDLGYLLDSFKDSSGYDPFICAQINLPSLQITQMFISEGEAHALAEVIVENQVRHYFVIQLGTGEGHWQIDAIHCPRDPQTAVRAFYTWYLGYMLGDVDAASAPEILHNTLEDLAYRRSFLVTDRFVQSIDAELADSQRQGTPTDPILNRDGYPLHFNIQPGPTENTFTAVLYYDVRTTHYHTLTVVEDPAGWKVDAIQHQTTPVFDPLADSDVDSSGWRTFSEPGYGFSLRYPPDWSIDYDRPSAMKDDPQKWGLTFTAPGVLADRHVLWLRVLEGSETDGINSHVTESHQEVTINDLTVWADWERDGMHYVFKHPNREDTWLVISEGRNGAAPAEQVTAVLAHVIAPLLRTVTFP